MTFRTLRPAALSLFAPMLVALPALANVPPAAPVITEPATDNRILNAEDVHMETGPFSDADVGDAHQCTNWEIWTVAPSARVWAIVCGTGLERLHVHLGDGAFEGSHAGRTSLLPATNYQLRVRHRDSSGDGLTEWSTFTTRPFSTAAASVVVGLELEDAAASPAPTLTDLTGAAVNLPGGASPGNITIDTVGSAAGKLVEFIGQTAGGNLINNPPALPGHGAVRVRIIAGGTALAIPDCNAAFTDDTGTLRTIYLPSSNVAAGQTRVLWVAANGSTYNGTLAQAAPEFSSLARGAAVPWTVRQPGFVVEQFATGFQLPVNIAFIPNPGMASDAPLFYVTELYGTIKLVRRNGVVSTYASNLLNFNPTGAFPGSGEQGVAGICVDPASGDVFATLLYDAAPPSGPHYPRVVRFHSHDGGVTAAMQTTILDMVGATQGQSHQISNITIGPDGKLYVHNGDGFDAAAAQNNSSFKGKILRLNFDGTPPTDNPFYNGAPFTSLDYIWASGVRNPFGGGWRALDQSHYIVENGPSVDRLTKLVRGRNYLWDGSDASMANFAIYNWNPSRAPVNITFIQPETFGGSGFPATHFGRAYVSESGPTWATGVQTLGKRVSEFNIDASGLFASGPLPLVEYNGSGKATCSAIAAGPDGLYFSDLYKDLNYTSPIDPGANILRIRYVGFAAFTNSTPIAEAAPLTVQFTDTSTVPGGATAWLWNFGDGTTSTQQNPSHTYTQTGVFTVRLTVTGAAGSVVTQRTGLVRIGVPPAIAFIGGSAAPNAAELAAANHLRSLGYEVNHFDDEPANRPGALSLASSHGLVIVSSTINSGSVAGEFRSVNLPMILWESALLTSTREGLSSAGSTVGSQTQIAITNNTHPVTRGLPLGNTAVFSSAQTISFGNGTIAAGAQVLATRTTVATDATIMVADAGATLLNGYVAPARRVFLYFQDSSFAAANNTSRQILANAACWALGLSPEIAAPPSPQSAAAGTTASFTVAATGVSPRTYQWRKGGVNLANDARISGATTETLTIANVMPSDAGNYDVIVSNTCGSVTSAAATLTVTAACPADFNGSGSVTVQDIFDFLGAYFANLPSADFNNSGSVTVQDIFDFLGAYFSGC